MSRHPKHSSLLARGEVLSLGAREAAEALGISERMLRSLVADRTSGIVTVRIGRRLLFPRHELERWLSERMVRREEGSK